MIDELKKLFESYREDMLRDLAALVAINSERGETTEEFPFGEGPAKALHTFLKMAEDMGFKTDNVDNYAGVVEYGEAEESVGILAHLDVVPAGKGWDSDPFTMVIRDGQMYGRGTCDDKGPAVAALYTLKAIRELGIPLNRSIKLVVGTNEEQGSACIDYYKAHRPLPTLGFTPDSSYPVTYAEKGCVWQTLEFPHEETPIISFKSGNAFNAVPYEALVVVDGKAISEEALTAAVNEETSLGFPVKITPRLDGNIEMLVRGKAAHGSMPYLGVNAAISAAMILRKAFGSQAGKAVDFLCDTIGRDVNGKTLGIYLEDPETGNLTLNIGIVNIENGNATATMDIRFPANGSVEMIMNGCKILEEQYGVTRIPDQLANPHYVPKDSELVTKLMDAYREVTGITDAVAETSGGGTYAKPMGGSFVAFGAEFPGRPDYKIHDANEHYGLDDWFEHCLISTYAVIKLAA